MSTQAPRALLVVEDDRGGNTDVEYPQVEVLDIDHAAGSALIRHLGRVPDGGSRTYRVDVDDILVEVLR